MEIIKYKTINSFTILKKLFVPGDTIYITRDGCTERGHMGRWYKVFDSKKDYLGIICDEYHLEIIRLIKKNIDHESNNNNSLGSDNQ